MRGSPFCTFGSGRGISGVCAYGLKNRVFTPEYLPLGPQEVSPAGDPVVLLED